MQTVYGKLAVVCSILYILTVVTGVVFAREVLCSFVILNLVCSVGVKMGVSLPRK